LKKKPSVAIYSGVSRSTTFIERLINGLVKEGTHIYVFGTDTGKPNHNKNVTYITYGRKWHKLLSLLKYSILLLLFKPKEKQKIDAIIASNSKGGYLLQLKYYQVLYHKPDVFHIQWAKSIEDWIWVEDFGMRLVLSLRGAHINYSPIVDKGLADTYKKLFPKVSGFHAVSKAMSKEVSKYDANIDCIKVIKSGLRLNEFLFEFKVYNPKTPLKITSIGRGHWVKNYKMALDAMSELKQLGIKFHYTIIGVKNDEALIHQRSQLSLDNEVSFIDRLPFNEIQTAIQEADVIVLPSVKEGIANVVLEAMALGTLVVSTNCGGMAEVVLPNKTGFLVPNRDILSMSKTLAKVSQLSLVDYQKITKQARVFVEKHHNEDQMVVEMQSLYQNLIPKRL
jgi:glycosyltransferase involved in cell wall biosynthesis